MKVAQLRSVSGIVASLILLLMFVGTVMIYATFMQAQQRVYQAQMEAARLAEEMRSIVRATLLYYNTSITTNGIILNIYVKNMGNMPVSIANLILEYGYIKANITFDFVIIGNLTDTDAPVFEHLVQLIQEFASITPDVNITLVLAEGGEESLASLPATIAPGDTLVVSVGPLPLDFKVYSVAAEAMMVLAGGSPVTTVITPQVGGTTVIVQQVSTGVVTGGTTATLTTVPFDEVTWVYGIPLRIECLYDRLEWPTLVTVNFTQLGIDYLVHPLGVRILDEDNNVWVPVNVTQVAPNYMVIVFPLTCKAGQLRNFTIFAAGGPISHPEGFYPVGLARLWNNTVVLAQGLTYYQSGSWIYYYVLEAPSGTLEPVDEATLANYETDVSAQVADGLSINLGNAVPYYDTSLLSVYVYSDVRVNTTVSDLEATPSISSLASSSPSLAPAWLAGWKYYIDIQFGNWGSQVVTDLTNVLINVTTDILPDAVRQHLFTHARPDGGDIIFVDLDTGELLPFITIEYDPVAQRAVWLVKVPYLGAYQTLRLGLYYGNPAYNMSLRTRIDIPSNLPYVYSFLSDIQPPSIHGYTWNYTVAILPVNTWSNVYAASNKPTPDASLLYAPILGIVDTTSLPAGLTFPFFGVAYDTGTWQVTAAGYLNYFADPWVATDVSWIRSLGDADAVEWEVYFNTSYSDDIGAGLLVRLNATLYTLTIRGWRVIYTPIGEANEAVILYANGVVRYVYGSISVASGYTPPTVQVDVMNSSITDWQIVYYVGYWTQLSNSNDVLFIPHVVLPVSVGWYHTAVGVYHASLDAAQIQLSRYSGGGFEVLHWKSSNGLYQNFLDVTLWLSWAGDILLSINVLPRVVGGYQLNYTVGFAPGIPGDPGVVLYSDADGVAGVYNWSEAGTLIQPLKEVLLLRYNGSYTVYVEKAIPLYPWVVGWLHGLRVVINNPNAFDIYNYTLRIVLGADNITSDYLSSPLFGKDIRVLDDKGNRIPFWVEKADPAVPVIVLWVRVPYLPANGNTTIYIYYLAQPPSGVSVVDESNPYRTFFLYTRVEPGTCPPWQVYNTTSYTCSKLVLGGYSEVTVVNTTLADSDIVRFYNGTLFGISGSYGFEYRAVIVPLSGAAEYDVAVELVPAGAETLAPNAAGSYAVVFGNGDIVRIVGGTLVTTWDQGVVTYSTGATYTVVIRLNSTSMQALVYDETTSLLVASATDSVAASGTYEASIVSYNVGATVSIAYSPIEFWVRSWVYPEPKVVNSVLLA
ncbi:protein of unknown function DUF2341 [Pyrolobus fumarii 1A]|uniref:DUF2341 domain-containing protein n=1 Tax=Pyrolobus fumarii (strain DSM 11204 / 1A) TaxID=694429 RepID=G0EH71_PYRF1|nr:protein of unknown function DUF2341 [Pyrolobus fumarii 1A]